VGLGQHRAGCVGGGPPRAQAADVYARVGRDRRRRPARWAWELVRHVEPAQIVSACAWEIHLG
jgi:hypothetical protein